MLKVMVTLLLRLYVLFVTVVPNHLFKINFELLKLKVLTVLLNFQAVLIVKNSFLEASIERGFAVRRRRNGDV